MDLYITDGLCVSQSIFVFARSAATAGFRQPLLAIREAERRHRAADIVGQDLPSDRRGRAGGAFGALAEPAGDADRGRRLGRPVLGIDPPVRLFGGRTPAPGP